MNHVPPRLDRVAASVKADWPEWDRGHWLEQVADGSEARREAAPEASDQGPPFKTRPS